MEKSGKPKPTAPNERGKNEVLIKNFKRFCQHTEPSPVLLCVPIIVTENRTLISKDK